MAALHLMGAVILFFVTRATSFGTVYALMLLYCLCYFPTINLTNSLTLRQLTNAGGEFPFIRMFATIGWIAIGLTIGSMRIETTATPFLLAAGVSVLMSAYCLTLPHTPPRARGRRSPRAICWGWMRWSCSRSVPTLFSRWPRFWRASR